MNFGHYDVALVDKMVVQKFKDIITEVGEFTFNLLLVIFYDSKYFGIIVFQLLFILNSLNNPPCVSPGLNAVLISHTQ